LFEREHHRRIALVLQALDPAVLAAHRCLFGGGSAIALRYGEFCETSTSWWPTPTATAVCANCWAAPPAWRRSRGPG
jgi:hypothetical protein